MGRSRVAQVFGVALVAGVFVLGAQTARGIEDGGAARVGGGAAELLSYDDWFTDEAMRVDLYHSGTGKESSYGLDEMVVEGRWAGTRRYLKDPFGYGTYRFRVVDQASGREIFQQGYATLFDEWVGTPEAQAGVRRTMSESVRFPMPKKSVILRIDQRGKDGKFQEVYQLGIEPSSYLISRAKPFAEFEVVELSAGPSPEKALDILIVPEGYALEDKSKLLSDFKRFSEALLRDDYWKTQLGRIHLRGVVAFSRESGVTEPRKGLFRDTILGSSFNTFDSPRYLTVVHTKTLRQIASRAPYDNLFVMVNSARYGGGGVYNQWSVYTSDNEYDEYVMLHEFGHHMAALADEYYTSAISNDEDIMYPPGTEPWEPNITAFLGKDLKNVKWRDLIAPGTPLPTMEGKVPLGTVGVFEGAGYKAKGLYRPQEDCKMFHKGLVGFCKVCTRAITDMVSYYAGAEIGR